MSLVVNILSLHFFEISKWMCQGWSSRYGFGAIICLDFCTWVITEAKGMIKNA